jgi:murein L,D-transpeptidase YafK
MLRHLLGFALLVSPSFQLLAQPCTPPTDSLARTVRTLGDVFWQQQLRFPRVRLALASTGLVVADRLRVCGLAPQRLELFLRVIKTHRELEVWARNQEDSCFELLRSYPLAATSGRLGPKRQANDYQVPEGFYEIDRFNPQIHYHLSLGLNYPNADDRDLGEPNPGGDVFIHGGEVTVGCLPITDISIEEVYLLALMAKAAGQVTIPVHIFPFPVTDTELAKRAASPHQAFWRGLMPGYAHFEKHHELAR